MNCIAFLNYDDARAAVDWLERAFGFERSSVHEANGKFARRAALRRQHGHAGSGIRKRLGDANPG